MHRTHLSCSLYTPMAYYSGRATMLTIVESPLFSKLWPDYSTEEERAEFCVFIAARPDAGDLVSRLGRLSQGSMVAPGHGKKWRCPRRLYDAVVSR